MEKLSGLVLDISDDATGEVLRSIFPNPTALPELVKSASEKYRWEEQRAALPDDLFALVLHDGEVTLRKFACPDAGHTALSVEYFLKTAHKLPAPAQKTAAANLCTACSWYDIEPPEELQKLALGLARAAHLALVGPEAVKKTTQGAQRNLTQARFSGGVVNPDVLGSSASPLGARR